MSPLNAGLKACARRVESIASTRVLLHQELGPPIFEKVDHRLAEKKIGREGGAGGGGGETMSFIC